MTARVTRRSIRAAVVWGGFGVLAWAAISILGGGDRAHADEHDANALGGVSSVVSGVTAPVTEVVSAVTAPVAPVVETVTDTVQGVTAPVTDVLRDELVSEVTTPVLDVVTELPIVGDVLDDSGVIDVIDDVVGVVDDTTGTVGDIVDDTTGTVVDIVDGATDAVVPTIPIDPPRPIGPVGPVDPRTPATPGDQGTPAGDDTAVVAAGAIMISPPDAAAMRPAAPRTASAAFAAAQAASAPAGAAPVSDQGDSAPSWTPAASSGAPGSSSASGSGGGAGACARVDESGVPPLRAWNRVSGAVDDALPVSAVADTDISPD